MKSNYNIKKIDEGFSIIELLVVITIFAVIGILVTRSIFLTLRGSKKSDSLVRVRESVNYSLSIIERHIRNAEVINNCTGVVSPTLSYTSIDGSIGLFSCITPGAAGYIASSSAGIRLTPADISITSCSFLCTQVNKNNPPIIRLSVSAEDAISTSTEKGTVTTDMEIVTRNY